MAMTIDSLRQGIRKIRAELETRHQVLTDLDARLGDGDLGFTLLKAFRAMAELADGLPDDLGQAFLQLGQVTSKASSSSFGTLTATALLAAAKRLRGRFSLEWSDIAGLVTTAREAMQARGKTSLGDKTVLDALAAIEKSLVGLTAPDAELAAARRAAAEAVAEFRTRPNLAGRARVYGDKTIGLDDPGMVAVQVMLEAL
jgi:dihydroxyacetone kinase-like protein